MNMHGQAIALLDPVDGNRAALRIEEGKLQLCCRAVLFACDNAAEGVFGFDRDDVAGIDREDRLCIRSIDVVETALPLDRELVALSSLTFGKAALCHDRGLEPVDRRSSRYPRKLPVMQIARPRWIFAPFVLVQLPVSAGFDRPSQPDQRYFLEVTPDQHQADR